MNSEWNDFFKGIREDYCNVMEEVHEETEAVLGTPEMECGVTDDPACMEEAVADSHNKILAAVVNKVMNVVGECIESVSEDCENDGSYTGRSDFRKGDHLCAGGFYHGLYAGCGKVVFFSKGYDMFPEVKLVPLSTFAKKGRIQQVESCSESSVKRAMSRLGKSSYRSSEEFVKWCKGEQL